MQSELNTDIWKKYNVPSPRYTSYPTVPFWSAIPETDEWKQAVTRAYQRDRERGISLYIHLPYCEKLCTYCGCNKRITVNHDVEMPYIEALLKEWDMYKGVLGDKLPIREIHLGGGTPTFFSPVHLRIMMESLMEGNTAMEDAEFSFEAHPANTTDSHLETLYGLGYRRLSLGIQDFDPYIQEVINRKQTFEEVDHVVNKARETGYLSVNFDLIYGLPFQKPETVADSIRKSIELRPDRIAFYSYAHVPWKAKGQRKYDENDLPSDREKRALYELGKEMLESAGYIEIGMDHFALQSDDLLKAQREGRLHRNFMGYTANPTTLLIGLGTSSISDSGDAFIQNRKVVEDYIDAVNIGDFPFFLGHLLNEEDLIIRHHITSLMCNFRTEWQSGSPDDAVMNEGICHLEECISDGLVIIEPNAVQVTDAGKAFVRNIAMAFDARLRRNKPDIKVFSSSI